MATASRNHQRAVVGVAMLTIGVGLFGVLTGFLANAFLAPKQTAPTRVSSLRTTCGRRSRSSSTSSASSASEV